MDFSTKKIQIDLYVRRSHCSVFSDCWFGIRNNEFYAEKLICVFYFGRLKKVFSLKIANWILV